MGLHDTMLFQWYASSERKAFTFRKLYENQQLNYEQVVRLKLAMAIYEVVPLVIFAPMGCIMLLKCARANSSNALKSATLWGLSLYSVSSVTARETRDRLYWPIVQDVVRQLRDQNERQNQIRSQIMMMAAGKQALNKTENKTSEASKDKEP